MPGTNDEMSRRRFLTRATLVSVGSVAAGSLAGSQIRAQDAAPMPPHGAELRGMELVLRDRSAEGRFGVMFKTLPGFAPADNLLTELGISMRELGTTPEENDQINDNPNPKLSAGFTFLGQFIDHDITFDSTPVPEQLADPYATVSFRTPRYDLDSLYGKGPRVEPQFYDPNDPDKFLIKVNANGVEDVPRTSDGRAIIPDPRNDQHLIIVQLHLAFMKFHNALVDQVRARGAAPATVFEAARQLARWHYQWIVIHDYLPRIIGQPLVDQIYQERLGRPPTITLTYYQPSNTAGKPFLPVEFAAAAFRFGHSMARPRYTISANVSRVALFEAVPSDNNLNGSRPIPARLKIEWSKFFEIDGTQRPARRIDTKLADPLFFLPTVILPEPENPQTLLAVRNLLRGKRLGLPSGQQVARAMGLTPLSNEELGLAPGWNGEAPLWFYTLKEAELQQGGRQLGAVAGRIIGEVLVGLLLRDRTSYLSMGPYFRPTPPIALEDGRFTMADLLMFAKVA